MITWIRTILCSTPPDKARAERIAQAWGDRRRDLLKRLYQEPVNSPKATVYRAEIFRLAQCIYELSSEFDLRPLDYLK